MGSSAIQQSSSLSFDRYLDSVMGVPDAANTANAEEVTSKSSGSEPGAKSPSASDAAHTLVDLNRDASVEKPLVQNSLKRQAQETRQPLALDATVDSIESARPSKLIKLAHPKSDLKSTENLYNKATKLLKHLDKPAQDFFTLFRDIKRASRVKLNGINTYAIVRFMFYAQNRYQNLPHQLAHNDPQKNALNSLDYAHYWEAFEAEHPDLALPAAFQSFCKDPANFYLVSQPPRKNPNHGSA